MSYIDELNENTVVVDSVEEIVDTHKQPDTEDNEYIPQFDEVEYEVEQTEKETKSKKKCPIQKTIIIAACLVFGALLTYLALALMIPSVEGTWLHKSQDGYEVYYTIDKTKDGYVLDVSFGTTHYSGGCDVTKTDSGITVTLITKIGQLYPDAPYGEYTYKISGNKLFKNATIELTDANGNVISLSQSKKTDISDYLKPYDDFKVNEKLVGEWMVDNSMYGMDPIVLTFNEDGTMILDVYGMQKEHYYYSPQEKTIKFSIYMGEQIENEMEYQFVEGNLVFLDTLWTRSSSASADQA